LNAAAIIEYCQHHGIQLFQRAGKLVVKPADKLTPHLSAAIRVHKVAILTALAHEDAQEYVAVRSAICAADGLSPCGIRPVFEYRLAADPCQPLIMLGIIGQSLEQAEASLRDRFGYARVLSIELYQWPPMPKGRLQ